MSLLTVRGVVLLSRCCYVLCAAASAVAAADAAGWLRRFKSSETAQAWPRPLEEPWPNPFAAEQEQQLQSFKLLVDCLNGCLDVQQQAEPRQVYLVAEETLDSSRWWP